MPAATTKRRHGKAFYFWIALAWAAFAWTVWYAVTMPSKSEYEEEGYGPTHNDPR